MDKENPQTVIEALKPIIPALIAFSIASLLVTIYE